jgi:hypothetical protein
MIIEANLKLIKDAFTAKDVESNSEALREPDQGSNLPFVNLDGEIVKIHGDKVSIANHNHLLPSALPVYADADCIICAQNGKGGARINEDPNSVAKNPNWNYWQEIASVKSVREFYNRHAISSSRGTRRTDGILRGSISRALSSTSFPESPTATNASFTTATYLPAYLSTSSLKCSTIQRLSLSIAISGKALGYENNGFYSQSNENLRKSQPVNKPHFAANFNRFSPCA